MHKVVSLGATLTFAERAAINGGRWFSSLSPALRHDILRCARVQRYRDGDLIAARGEPPTEWTAVARGAVRVGHDNMLGKQYTLTYVEPGVWFGDIAILDGERRTHDAWAHGSTTLLCVARDDLLRILAQHAELYAALARLQARRLRNMFDLIEDLTTLALRPRLAKQLLQLTRSYGEHSDCAEGEIRIGLHLAQENLAQLLGASRQRVNQELKSMERLAAIRIRRGELVVRNLGALRELAAA